MPKFPNLQPMLIELLESLKSDLTQRTFDFAWNMADNGEYGMSLEVIAFEAVALTVPWNRELFSSIAQLMKSTDAEYFKEAWKSRRSEGRSVRNDRSYAALYSSKKERDDKPRDEPTTIGHKGDLIRAAMNIPSTEQFDEFECEMCKDDPDLVRACNLLIQAREAGDRKASYALATWYIYGNPPAVKRSIRKALPLLIEAMDAGIPEAAYELAILRERGKGGDVDVVAAAQLFLYAALRDHARSIFAIGQRYYYGQGVRKDRGVAAVWLDRAAELGIYGHEDPPINVKTNTSTKKRKQRPTG